MLRLAVAVFASGAVAAAAPPPNASIPRDAPKLARTITANDAGLRAAIAAWDRRSRPSSDVTLYALYDQRIVRLLARSPRLAARTLRLLSAGVARSIRDPMLAKRDLDAITPISPLRRIRTGRALPPHVLLGFYRAAQRRFGVAWQVLAAVNFVETAFNKVRNSSATGAQGPMQFMPGTWRAYGLGGDVHDPHDAIMGAANYLHASGAPRNYPRALHAYNPSPRYVDAVLRYARRIRVDPQAYYRFYSWQVIVRTPHGDRRLTGPGR